MKLITITIITLCLFTGAAFAQTGYSIRGAAADTSQFLKMYDASVIVLNGKDSILRKFTRAKEDGSFAISGLPAGSYLLLVTYPAYTGHMEKFTLDAAHPAHNFGTINMKAKEKVLNEVEIKGEVQAVKIKGDTIEFNAKAYVVQPNDKVEDLLKQIPGITVDKDGKITANGEAVQKVLVDGEEFFGDDPTLVTQNLRADMVDKVQLYDKKSDQATFTGIDDGQKTKTINVVLKQDKKKGTFGKVAGGVGNDQYYEGQALWNKFTATAKYAVYGTDANDGKAGLGYADQDKIGASNTNVVAVDGGIAIYSSGDNDFQSSYNGNGLPLARTGGVHYDDKWDNGQRSLNTNFKIGSLEVTGYQSIVSQLSLPGFVNNTNTLRNFDNYSFKQKLDATYNATIDTTSTIKISTDGSLKNMHNKITTATETTDGSGGLLNRLAESQDNHYDERLFDISAFYTKKLKRGHTFSWSLSESYDEIQTHSNQLSTTNYYKAGTIDSSSVVNQYKPNTTISSVINSNMTYSSLLSKKWSLLFNYGFALNNSSADLLSYNQDPGGAYTLLDPTYSSNYKFNQLTNQVGAIFNYKTAKITWNFGTKASDVDFTQIDEFTGKEYKRTFINWLPQSTFQYRIGQSKSLYVYYNGNTSQPSISQLQPIATNTNPLNIVIGNPDLKPSFSSRFNFQYISQQIISQQSFFVFGSYGFTSDQIVSDVTTNTAGQSTTQSVNLTGQTPYNYSLQGQYSRKIVPWDLNTGISLSTFGNVNYSYTNGEINRSVTNNYSVSLNFRKSKVKEYDFYLSGGPGFASSDFSLTPANNNSYPIFSLNGSGNLFLPGKFQITSNMYASYQGKTQQLSALERNIWNASLIKSFLKDDNLKVSLVANNILNQNQTLQRNVSGNSISQNYYNTVMRYFMLTVSWDFTKFGTTSTPAKN